MAYRCDVCSTDIGTKANGRFFSQQDVLLNPAYWEVVMRNPMLAGAGGEVAENAYGLFIQNFLNDTSGFTACEKCAATLNAAPVKLKDYGLDSYFAQATRTGQDPVLIVAGTTWERKHGRWPSCIHNDIKRKRDCARERAIRQPTVISPALSQKKWWQIWK